VCWLFYILFVRYEFRLIGVGLIKGKQCNFNYEAKQGNYVSSAKSDDSEGELGVN
jgi:hypothetical protein